MAKDVPIGARGTAEETVEFKHTLTAHHPELPPVYSTPDMIHKVREGTRKKMRRCLLRETSWPSWLVGLKNRLHPAIPH